MTFIEILVTVVRNERSLSEYNKMVERLICTTTTTSIVKHNINGTLSIFWLSTIVLMKAWGKMKHKGNCEGKNTILYEIL